MTFPSLDYFRCEPFELNFRLHALGGFWPLETRTRWKQWAFSVFSFISFFSLISLGAIQIADIYVLRHDPVKLTRDLSLISVSLAITSKSVFVLYKVDLMNALRREFAEYKNSRSDPADVEILEESNGRILKVTRTFYAMTVACVIFWMLYPALDNAQEKRVPFPYLLPVDEWTPPIYFGLYAYHSMALIGFMINIVSVDSIFCSFLMRIDAHYDIIIKNLKALKDGGNTSTVIKENVKLHQKILREMKALEEIYSLSSVVHFGGIVPIIGIAIIDLVRIAKGFRLQILQKMLYVSVGLWDTFLYCYYATKTQEKSLELSLAVYDAPWYEMKAEARRDLLFVFFKSQRAPKIKVAGLFALNLKTFVSILKISYDITALLFQTVKE